MGNPINRYKLKTTIFFQDDYYTCTDIQAAVSEKQAKFCFYQRIKMKIDTDDNLKFVTKVDCKLDKENIKSYMLDLAFHNFTIQNGR